MDIFVPSSLNSADAALNLADSLAKLLDPKERAKIADDIKAHHALNDAQAKKHTDALALIKKHQDILDETLRTEIKNKKESADLDQARKDFETYCSGERTKISAEWAKVQDAAEVAKNLHIKAENMISSVAAREDGLRKDKETHAVAVKKLVTDTLSLEEKRKGIEKFQSEVVAMDNATKTKVEKLKQFNF